MIDSFSGYVIAVLYAFAILKLLMINSLVKIGLASLLIFTLFVGVVSMTGAALVSPLLFFNPSNETIGVAILVVFPLVAATITYINRKKIIDGLRDFIYEIKEDGKNNGENLSEILRDNNLEVSLKKYFKIIIQDIENQIFYSIGFFALLQSTLYFIYAHDYMPLFGQLIDYKIFYINKLHLLWLIPLTFALSYIYSRFYYEGISNSKFQNFLAMCRFGEHHEMQVVVGEGLLSFGAAENLIVIKNRSISEFFEIAPKITFISTKEGIYLLLNKNKSYKDFRIAYHYIKSIGPIVFSKNYYRTL